MRLARELVTWQLCSLRSPHAGRAIFSAPSHAYTSQSSVRGAATAKRKQVTVVNDDGRVTWGDLSAREKAARTTQKTFHLGIVLTGLVMTGGVAYLLYTEVFASDSRTSVFNRAFDEIRASPRVIEALGPGNKIIAFGEPTSNRWARARPIASTVKKDRSGREHLLMHFNVQGPRDSGIVNVHMVKNAESSEYEYKYLSLDVKDVENKEKKKGFRLFGAQWG
ncbi:mitochondrial import inner membrane translocase subunit tim21 [Ptychographa xylographoides]|nr:mitochondrial import inner membrane translocase subunit tim21 [Ptychographa xylographoides]